MPQLRLVFSVVYDVLLPDAKLEVELFDDDGKQCWLTFVNHAVPASTREQIAVSGWTTDHGGCPAFPQHIGTVKATLLTLREPVVDNRLQRTDYLSQSFPVSYSIQRYPPPPSGVSPSPPAITELSWGCGTGCSGGSGPIPGDPFSVTCVVRETDGAPITAAGTITWDGRPPKTFIRSFPAGASSSPEGVRMYFGETAPNAPQATVLCVATNDRGESAQKTVEVGVRK
jgi:hypothetical protein